MACSPKSRAVLAGLLLLAPACLGAAPAPKTAVTAVRYWTLNDATRVVIEASGEFEFTSDRAINPDRIFFDVKGARLKLGAKGQHVISVGDQLLRQVRIAETQPGVTRVVFDLQDLVEFSASQLSNPNRLIVELRPATTRPPSLASLPVPEVVPPSLAAKTIPAVTLSSAPEPPISTGASKVKSSSETKSTRPPVNLKPPKAATLSNGSQSMARVLGLKIGRIVLDAGHGGHDTGTAGPGGLYEKDLVLDVTKRLGALIETRMGAEVVYTRSDDTFVGLENRTQIANEHKADLFLSIHANSSPVSVSSGVETYYLNFTSSKSAMEVAARENASSQKTVYELKDLLQKIALQDKIEESREFAARVQQGLYTASVRANNRTRNRGVKTAPFVVLIGASMPSVLAEIGFINNPKDEALLKKDSTRQKIAEGLYKGLAQYAGTLSQFQVASN